MARSRSLPTCLFEDPDFFEQSSDTQVILLGMVLYADDYGRGQAHIGLLARKFNKTAAQVEEALIMLETHKLLVCYQVDGKSYYALTRWGEWETLSKPTPSKYPAPPAENTCQSQHDFLDSTRASGKQMDQHNPDSSENLRERIQKIERNDGVGKEIPANIVTFPTTHADTSANIPISPKHVQEKTQEVAAILTLAVDDALVRIVEEHLLDPTLSLLGEADAAREWIENPRRNQKGQCMSPAFFRRWLKRERETILARKEQQQTGVLRNGLIKRENQPLAEHVQAITESITVDPYTAYVQRRQREAYETWLAKQTEAQVREDQVCTG